MATVPLVSCLVVTYNFERFILRALESAFAQDYPMESLQVVVVDDGSTDQTPELLAPYLDRITYIRKQNGGLISSTNRALAEAKGEFIAFLSGDDAWPRNKVRRQVDFLLAHPEVGMVYGDMSIVDQDDRVLNPSSFAAFHTTPRRGRLFGSLLKGNFISGGAMMLRGSLKERFHPIPPEVAWEDWWFALKVAEVAEIDYVEDVVYHYRLHGQNMNLGVTGERRGQLLRKEIPFRRELVRRLAPGKGTLQEGVEAYLVLESVVISAAQLLGLHLAEVIEVGKEDHLRSQEALELGSRRLPTDPEGAAYHFLTTLAWNPWNQPARLNLSVALESCGRTDLARLVWDRDYVFAESPQRPGIPLVSIIIPTRNQWGSTSRCLEHVARTTQGMTVELILVDNASTDETIQALPRLSGQCRVLRNETDLGVGKASNQGARLAVGKYLVFLDPASEPQPGWLEALLAAAEAEPQSGAAVVGATLCSPDGSRRQGGAVFAYAAPYPLTVVPLDSRPVEGESLFREASVIPAACLLLPSEVFRDAGGFDEGYVSRYHDFDLCLRLARATGAKVGWAPGSEVVWHRLGQNPEQAAPADRDRFHREWLGKLRPDGAPSPETPPPASPRVSRPGCSVVVLTYNSLKTVAPCLERLVRYTSPEDELIVVDNASKDATLAFVENFAKHSGRLRILQSDQNVGFSRGTNLGIEAATKDFVVFLNPDVEVTAGWLDRMLAHLTADPKVGAVGPTSDYVAGLQKVELYLDSVGGKDPDQLAAVLAERRLGQSVETPLLIGFCLSSRRDLLNDLGNLDPELFLGNDDLDLSLRLRQRGYRLLVATDVFVRHFGQVSFGTEPGTKTRYLVQQSTNLLYEKLYRRYRGQVPSGEETWGIPWFQPQTGLTSIILLAHNNLEVTAQCIETVYANTARDFELILVDNGSTEDVASYAAALQAAHGNVTYIRNEENQGYGYGCNQGLAAARGQYLVLLNNDVLVTPGWLSKQLALLDLDEKVGMVGPRTNYSAGLQQVDGVSYKDQEGLTTFADDWFVAHAGEFIPVPRITGVCMVMKRAVLERVGGFDTLFGVGNFEDDDLCLRVVRAGFVIAIANDVFVHHYGSTTFKSVRVDYNRLMAENWRFFCHKWGHTGEMKDGYQAVQLAQARPFSPVRDAIPVRYENVFHPGARPLTIDGLRPVRFLCIPDWNEPAWREVVVRYFEAFTSDDPVSLVVRVEPPLPESADQALAAIQSVMDQRGLSENAIADVVIETSTIPSSQRGGLYVGMTALLACPGTREALYTREARACGLPVVCESSVTVLRQLAERQAPQDELAGA